MTGLSALATALSTYLGWHYLSGLAVLGCGGGTPCDRVLQSRAPDTMAVQKYDIRRPEGQGGGF